MFMEKFYFHYKTYVLFKDTLKFKYRFTCREAFKSLDMNSADIYSLCWHTPLWNVLRHKNSCEVGSNWNVKRFRIRVLFLPEKWASTLHLLIGGRSRAARWDGVTRITAVRLSREPRSLWYDRGRSHIFELCAAIWHRCPFSTAITTLVSEYIYIFASKLLLWWNRQCNTQIHVTLRTCLTKR